MAADRISWRTRKRIDRFFTRLENIAKMVNMVPEDSITDLFRRAAIPTQPNGFPSNSTPEATSGGSMSDPTFSAGASRARGKGMRDPVRNLSDKLEGLAKTADEAMQDLTTGLKEIGVKLEEGKKCKSTDPCEVCLELPAEKSGFCSNDHVNWIRHGRPDRQQWILYMRKQKNSEGILLVPECPKPADGAKATRGPWK